MPYFEKSFKYQTNALIEPVRYPPGNDISLWFKNNLLSSLLIRNQAYDLRIFFLISLSSYTEEHFIPSEAIIQRQV